MEKKRTKRIEKLSDWLESHEIDHPEYLKKFEELKKLDDLNKKYRIS